MIKSAVIPFVLGSMVFFPMPTTYAQSELRPSVNADRLSGAWADLPPAPRGKSTIFGGAIRNFDPVRDQFTLDVVGQRPMRILFDERTQIFRDGTKVPLRNLGPEDHASVETTLDGADVFAVSIHILSQAPEGQYEGKVISYEPQSGGLSIRASSSPDLFKVFVSTQTQFVRVGQRQFTSVQSGPSDLAPGSLVSIEFQSQKPGHAVASTITVLAVPGSTFSFSGNLVSFDLASGSLELMDPNDGKDYRILFTPSAFPASRSFHPGDRVRVTAEYNGNGFVARELAAN
jgi:hypothetical protein